MGVSEMTTKDYLNSRMARLAKSNKTIEKLWQLHTEMGIPTEKIALDCKVRNGTVVRWFRNWRKDELRPIQPAQLFFLEKFVEKYGGEYIVSE